MVIVGDGVAAVVDGVVIVSAVLALTSGAIFYGDVVVGTGVPLSL